MQPTERHAEVTGGSVRRVTVASHRGASGQMLSPGALPRSARRWVHSARVWENVGLTVLGALALLLTTWRLADNGYANGYYAAAVHSMALNPHAFFFVSLDPGGFVSIDKPPVGLWLQVLSVKLLGFSPLALLLPQAILGALAVPLLGILVRWGFGGAAGLLAALALAVTPIWVVTSRDNVIDTTLAFVLLLAVAALLRACAPSRRARAQQASSRAGFWAGIGWLALAFGLVGLGFNIKMLEAFLVVPAFTVTYLLCARRSLVQRALTLAVAGVVLVCVSLAWVEAVDLTPPGQRPYVGSTTSNSELDLAIGYNGLNRLLGRQSTGDEALQFAQVEPSSRVGAPGALRFFQRELGPQASWLLPLALLGLIAAWPFTLTLRRRRRAATVRQGVANQHATAWASVSATYPSIEAYDADDTPLDRHADAVRNASYVVWSLWLLTGLVFFSLSRHMDDYYLLVIAPALAAAVGCGAVALWRAYRGGGWRGWLAPLVFGATLCAQAYLVGAVPRLGWLAQPLALTGIVGGLTLVVARLLQLRASAPRTVRIRAAFVLMHATVTLLAVAALLAPLIWTLGSLTQGNSDSHPIAGPQYAHAGVRKPPHVDARLLAYLEAQRGGAYYLVGVRDAGTAEPLILATDAAVMTMGGFGGSDAILTTTTLQQQIAANNVRYFYLAASNVTAKQRAALYAAQFLGKHGSLGGPAYRSTGHLDHWIATNCAPVLPSKWSSDSAARKHLLTNQLFDCSALVVSSHASDYAVISPDMR